MDQQYKYFAFISYNSHDQSWGKRLQRKLEHYQMPATLCSQHGWNRIPIKPVFFAPTDIQPGGLSDELQQRLQASRNLIVICSPNSAKSEWVGREIEYFHSLGRTRNIHFFIVDGTPHSNDPDTECFNPVVNQLGLPEILGANIHEQVYRLPWLNRERAYVQLISKLLGVEFDTIWKRHRRLLVQKVLAWTLGAIAVLAALGFTWKANQPFDAEIRLTEGSCHNEYLPPLKDAVVTITLDNETKTDTLRSLDSPVVFSNIPHRYLGEPVHINILCQNYLPLDTTLPLAEAVSVAVLRDPAVFGNIRVKLWSISKERPLSGTEVRILDYTVTSDADGYVTLTIPLEEQRPRYPISSNRPAIGDSITMPCGPDDIIIAE